MNEATFLQNLAADPQASTWLSANAGSGKTRVLTDRVARLLLLEVDPQNILCLTYTKAAASEMQNRLFLRLGEWSMKSVEDLREELARLGVEDSASSDKLARARQLFARAIETPGGLRIQTIHSYCASLLRRFPMEAEVSPNFKEMDDRSAKVLRDWVVEDLAEIDPGSFRALTEYLTGDDLDPLLSAVLKERESLKNPASRSEVFRWFGLLEDVDEATLVNEVFGDLDVQAMNRIRAEMRRSEKVTDQKTAAALDKIKWDALGLDDAKALFGVLLFGASAKAPFGAKIGTIPTKACQAALGEDLEHLNNLMQRVEGTRDRINSLYAAQKTLNLHRFAGAFLPAYEAEKSRRGWLDFDDLILKSRALLSDPNVAAWVLYRLDGGLDHILVDEAQDTSPAQWQVVRQLAQELTSGKGAREDAHRSIFVVGDKKQSIYSFQGADPGQFDILRSWFEERLLGSDAPLQRRELSHSFRSSSAILRFVDQSVGLSELKHRAFHEDYPGRVDLWPTVPEVEKPEKAHWFDPVDLVAQDHHTIVLARRIASYLKQVIGTETIPATNGTRRRVRASDVLVLVRRRSRLFDAIIRECKSVGLPVAGADRLKLGTELAVKDIMAVLAFLATPEDDLSLAAALKSPIFGWSEAQLFDLAAGRESLYLWQELRRRRDDFRVAFDVLSDLRNHADFLRPFDVIERILTRHKGRQNLLARLGPEAEDGIDELITQSLNYERLEIPSLTGFLTWLESDDVEVKRQMDSAGDQIRVMTVHGAKGLESPIVLLPDTAKWSTRSGDQVVDLGDGRPSWSVPQIAQPDVMRAALEKAKRAQEEERERLYYVAATRAESWLIFAAAGDVGTGEDSWHQKAQGGLETVGATALETPTGVGLRYQIGDWAAGEEQTATRVVAASAEVPSWATQKVAAIARPTGPRRPSDLGGAKALASAAGQDEAAAKTHGSMVHRILEGGPQAFYAGSAERVLRAEFPEVAPEQALRAARRVFEAPHLQHLFGPDVFSEISVTADVPDLGPMMGVIDKLIVGEKKILAVDFKTNAEVPASEGEVPSGLLRQMGAYSAMLEKIYPERDVDVAILWTETAQLMPLSHEIVRTALQQTPTS